jgi:hypothetical protein
VTLIASSRPVPSPPWGCAVGPQPARPRYQAELDHVVASARPPASATIGIDTFQLVSPPRRRGTVKVRGRGLPRLRGSAIAHGAVTGFGSTLAHELDVEVRIKVRESSATRPRQPRPGAAEGSRPRCLMSAIPQLEAAGPPPAVQPRLREAVR